MDLTALLHEAHVNDLTVAREALQTIHDRGFNRGKNLLAEFESLLRP